MGGFFSCGLDQLFIHVCSCFVGEVNYICNLEKNLAALEKAMKVLRARRADVLKRVQREESQGLQRLDEVQVWLTNVENIQNQAYELLLPCTDELERFCLCGLCTKDLGLSYSYGKKVFEMLEEVEALKSAGVFELLAGPPTIAVVVERPQQRKIFGQKTILEKAWNHLKDDGTKIMGLYGMGGVGKTTLLEQINNKFLEAIDGFQIVIWVVVSSELRVDKIQDEIAEKLGFGGENWKQKEKRQKVTDIHTYLKNKKFVLLLDDIWREVDLKEIGVPFPTRGNGCKVVFTTRSREVCGHMGVDDPMEVKCLDSNEAWDLFRSKVGKITLESHPDILELACQVARKCRGLPLALNIIGKNMACKRTVEEWAQAIDTLASSAAGFLGMENHIFPVLMYSYNSLREDQVKSCFQYCALYPEDFLIEKEKLVDYWICEGFIDEKQGKKKAKNQVYGIIGTLVQACLLIEGKDKSLVSMHDVVREMALWIASDLGKHKERCIVQTGVGLREVPKVQNWNNVRRMSLMGNEIEKISESPDCPELTTLLLGQVSQIENKSLASISDEFFQSMPRLLVLDLSQNSNFSGLPEQISGLVSLRYLDLSHTSIKRLPVGLQELKMLIHLNLELTRELESLDGISKLSSLRTLKLLHSKVWLDMRLMKELQLLEHLEFISIDISSSLAGELLVYDPRIMRCIQQVSIVGKRGEESVRELVLPAMDNLCELYISDCGISEIKIEKTPWDKSLTSPCFSNLSHVLVSGCHGLKDVTWLLFAPNLTHLSLWRLEQVEEIISKEKAASLLEKETCNIIPFQKLERLILSELPELKSIYWKALPLQRLSYLYIAGNYPKLRKLPLYSKSVFKVEEVVIENKKEEWIKGIEWEDEATRRRFLPSCRRFGVSA